jgi:hypothetical protein
MRFSEAESGFYNELFDLSANVAVAGVFPLCTPHIARVAANASSLWSPSRGSSGQAARRAASTEWWHSEFDFNLPMNDDATTTSFAHSHGSAASVELGVTLSSAFAKESQVFELPT